MGDAEYTPRHPQAYAGRPGFLAAPWRRSPFVVDEPGVFVGGDGDEGERLVHWESIGEIVLYETTVRGAGGVRTVDAVGLRLRDRPDVIGVQRVLTGWTLDRTELEGAVARFAPGVALVDGPPQTARGRLAAELGRVTDAAETDDVTRPPGEPRYGPRAAAPEPGPTPAPAPADGTPEPPPAHGTPEPPPAHGSPGAADAAAAYVIRPDVRTAARPALTALVGVAVAGFMLMSGLGIFALFGVAFGIPLVAHVIDARRGIVYFAVDADGVYLGQAVDRHGSDSLEVRAPWESIATVTVFEIEEVTTDAHGDRTREWHTAVGLRLRDGRPGNGGVAHYQVFKKYGLDRRALEAAVGRFGGGTPVVDGPALGGTSLGDVAGAVLDFLRNRGQSGQS